MFKLLGIGNSFSDDAFEYVYTMIKSLKIKDVAVNNLYIGGCSLDLHYDNITKNLPAYDYRRFDMGVSSPYFRISDALKSDDWQYITMQQASGSSGLIETYSNLGKLIKKVKELKPKNAKLFWHMTWSYRNGANHLEFPNYKSDQMTMYNAIVDCVKKKILPNKDFVKVIPSGTAIQNARSSSLGDSLNRDGFHLSYDLGRYIAGLCVVCTLLNIEPETIPFTVESIDPLRKQIAIESVKNALKNPFSVTQSKL